MPGIGCADEDERTGGEEDRRQRVMPSHKTANEWASKLASELRCQGITKDCADKV